MTRSLLVPLFVVGCHGGEASAVPGSQLSTDVAFVSQCGYQNGARVMLAHRFGSSSYRLVVSYEDNIDISTITWAEADHWQIETNGGLGKVVAVEELTSWLLTRQFNVVHENDFADELARRDVTSCPGEYPFSPPTE